MWDEEYKYDFGFFIGGGGGRIGWRNRVAASLGFMEENVEKWEWQNTEERARANRREKRLR